MLRQKLTYLAIATFSMALATGCQFYIEDSNNDDGGWVGDGDGDGDGDFFPGSDCTDSAQCAAGCYCNADSICEETGFCSSDADCAGDMTCDDRGTCVPDDGPPPTCVEDATVCGDGQTCDTETAECRDLTCNDNTAEADCLADDTCTAVYTGVNCTDPTGAACSEPGANCTCESFNFRECETTPTEP